MAKFLSIDADSHGLLVALGSSYRDKLSIDRLIAATDLAQPLTAANAVLVGTRLKELLKDSKIAAAPALVVLGRDRVILKDIRHPPVPRSDEPGVIRFQALKEIAEGGEEMAFDYFPLPGGVNERRATVAFVKKDVVAAVRTMCEAAGLKLAAVTPRPYAVAVALGQAARQGAVPAPEPGTAVGIVMVHEGGGEFTICRDGIVALTRTIPATAIATEATLIPELRRNLAVASGQACDVQALYLSEAETRGEGWAGRLRADLGLPVYTFDPLASLEASSQIPAELHGRFLGVVGLLTARSAPNLPINFIQPRQPRRGSEGESPAKKRALIAAIAAILLVGALGIGGWLLLDSAESKAAGLRTQIQQIESRISAREVDAKRLAAVEDLNNREINWLDELYQFSAIFPDVKKARLLHFNGQTLPLPTEKERQAEAAKPPNKNTPPKKVAALQLTVVTDDITIVQSLKNAIHADRFYSGATSKITKAGHVIDLAVAHRAPGDFTIRLVPAKSEPVKGEGRPVEPVKVEKSSDGSVKVTEGSGK